MGKEKAGTKHICIRRHHKFYTNDRRNKFYGYNINYILLGIYFLIILIIFLQI